MSNPETYPWQAAYGSAILGTNNAKLIGRIADARKAIEHRLCNPIEVDSREHLAIRAAWKGLVALESEPNHPAHESFAEGQIAAL